MAIVAVVLAIVLPLVLGKKPTPPGPEPIPPNPFDYPEFNAYKVRDTFSNEFKSSGVIEYSHDFVKNSAHSEL